MIKKPDWLPPVVSIDGEWNRVLKRLYKIFEADIKKSKLSLHRKPIWWDNRVLDIYGYEEGFWHLITREKTKTKERLFDPRRAERLPWFNPIIKNALDNQVKVWDFKEASGKIRTYVWLENWDYVIILEKKNMRLGEVFFLVTTFHVDGESKRRDLRNKFRKQIKCNHRPKGR